MSELSDLIETAASQPASVTTAAGSATSRPLKDLVEADAALTARTELDGTNAQGGARSAWGCVRPARVQPPGAP